MKKVFDDETTFARSNGYSIMKNKGKVVMIISPENSYYSEKNVLEHLECCVNNFSKVYLMIPEGPMVHNYLAAGKNNKYAETKARLKCNNVRNKASRSIGVLAEMYSSEILSNIKILDWQKEIMTSDFYRKELSRFNAFYSENAVFKNSVNDAVTHILGKMMSEKLTEHAINEGSQYVLEELAFTSVAPKVLNSEKMCFSYHRDWNIFEDYVSGIYDGKIKKDIGFVLMK